VGIYDAFGDEAPYCDEVSDDYAGICIDRKSYVKPDII
jgi:hypothetical protein